MCSSILPSIYWFLFRILHQKLSWTKDIWSAALVSFAIFWGWGCIAGYLLLFFFVVFSLSSNIALKFCYSWYMSAMNTSTCYCPFLSSCLRCCLNSKSFHCRSYIDRQQHTTLFYSSTNQFEFAAFFAYLQCCLLSSIPSYH